MVGKLTYDDRRLGPITYGRAGWKTLSIIWGSGGGDDDSPRNSLIVYGFGWVARLFLPNILQPFRIRQVAVGWDAATVARLGRDWYYETYPREYGFRLTDGHFVVYLGAQTHDSSTTQDWSCFLPWTQWRHVRQGMYGLKGELFWERFDSEKGGDRRGELNTWLEAREKCPSLQFEFADYDGETIVATTRIEEREWRFGDGWFKWLSWFRSPKVRRSLELSFGSEVGPEKGSWKGGITGHGIQMQPGELHEDAFRRYCEMEHEHKGSKFRLKFIGRVETAALGADGATKAEGFSW